MSTGIQQPHESVNGPSVATTVLTPDRVAKFLPLSAKGINADGRIIHVTHQIPFNILRKQNEYMLAAESLPSPPGTPPRGRGETTEISVESDSAKEQWLFVHRRGHSAMYSGIQSVSQERESIHIGWTGNIHEQHTKRVVSDLHDHDKKVLTKLLEEKNIVPIFLDKTQSHNHYEGYCKSSMIILYLCLFYYKCYCNFGIS